MPRSRRAGGVEELLPPELSTDDRVGRTWLAVLVAGLALGVLSWWGDEGPDVETGWRVLALLANLAAPWDSSRVWTFSNWWHSIDLIVCVSLATVALWLPIWLVRARDRMPLTLVLTVVIATVGAVALGLLRTMPL